MDKDKRIFSYVGIVVGVILLMAVALVMNGWALTKLWEWFIVPVFNIGSITIVQAIGIAMVVSFLTNNLATKEIDGDDTTSLFIKGFVIAIFSPLLAVGIGWIITGFL